MEIKKLKYPFILILFAIIIICSAILSFIPIEQACKINSNSCLEVHSSKYDSLLGINNSYLGLIIFTALFVITIMQIKYPSKTKYKIILSGLIIGTLVAIYFLCIQFIILKATCLYCLIIDFATIISLLTFIFVK